MQVTKEYSNPTTIKLTITADDSLISSTKKDVLTYLGKNRVRLQGFRPGKAPLNLVEKSVDQNVLQSEFLESAVNRMYIDAITEQKIRPVAQPTVSIKKFVPFTTLEIEAEVQAVGEIKLTDYTKVKVAKKPVKVTDADVTEVINNLKSRAATYKDVTRAAKAGDQVVIDFAGRDTKTDEPIEGGEGKDYSLVIGSNTFIPGFEDNLVATKAGDEKEFNITFPKDYSVEALQGKKATFKVTVHRIQKVVEPKLDDAFAASVGPFKTIDELTEDIKKQLELEKQNQADRAHENEVLEEIAVKSDVAIPVSLIDEELERIEQQERQNVAYQGQTWKEHLAAEGITEEEHKEKNRPQAELRVKAGSLLAEIAEKENIQVTPEELEVQVQLHKGQYQDAAMRAELDKPENRRDIASRLMTQKTIERVTEIASAKPAPKAKPSSNAKK